ncbi:hypothetical protein QX776_17850 [Alteromonadaceae bacterium BrNp21-10]|nr:hypothetical protein [Alteromonadaceae bacterium BrNp21-10]
MVNQSNSTPCATKAQTAASPEGDEQAASAKNPAAQMDDMTRMLSVTKLSLAWLGNLRDTAQLELARSVSAIKRSIMLQLALIPMLLMLNFSICGVISYLVYHETQSIYWGLTSLIGIQLLAIVLVVTTIRNLRQQVGFKHTTEQIKGVSYEITQAFK